MKLEISIILLCIVAGIAGCVNHPTVAIADNAPIWLSRDTVVRDPYYLEKGTNQKVQAKGDYVRHAGAMVYLQPAH